MDIAGNTDFWRDGAIGVGRRLSILCFDPQSGQDDITSLRRIRAAIQLTVLAAVLLLPLALFRNPAHVLTASGLLFDIAGALRLFLLEEIDHQIADVNSRNRGCKPL
jgi:hypothetical protein